MTVRRKVLVVAIVAVVAAVGSVVALNASADSSGRKAGVAVSKSRLPANVNQGKNPILDPGQITDEPSTDLTPQQQRDQATTWAAQERTSRLACYAPDRSVAGVAEVDRVDPTTPPTGKEAQAVCTQGWPGSRP